MVRGAWWRWSWGSGGNKDAAGAVSVGSASDAGIDEPATASVAVGRLEPSVD